MNLIIIPGFGETPEDEGYSTIANEAEQSGYNVIPIEIKWNRTTLDHWITQTNSIFKTIDTEPSVVFGFSMGAMIALLGTQNYNFVHATICSLSPYFKEDLSALPESAKAFFGEQRMKVFTQFVTPTTSDTPATFFFGDQDWPYAVQKSQDLSKKWKPTADFKLLQGVGHEINHPRYVSAVNSLLKQMLMGRP